MARSQVRVRIRLQLRGTEGFLKLNFLIIKSCSSILLRLGLRNRHGYWASWASTCLSLISPCWAGPWVLKVGTLEVMPTSVAPECLVESKTRARTQKPFDSSRCRSLCNHPKSWKHPKLFVEIEVKKGVRGDAFSALKDIVATLILL